MTRGQARSALAFGALATALIQVGLNLALPAACVYLGDPEYEVRLKSTRRLLLAHPERPLVVALGSSHTLTGLSPAALGPEAPFLLMNFGHTDSGPIVELLYLRRLLADGVRPAHVFVELMPALLGKHEPVECLAPLPRLGWHDLVTLAAYSEQPGRMYLEWARWQMASDYPLRMALDRDGLPAWHPCDTVWQSYARELDAYGWRRFPCEDATEQQRVFWSRNDYNLFGQYLRTFSVAPVQDRALRDLIDLCRREGIDVTLYLMPESSIFRAFYSPASEATLAAYLQGLRERFGVVIVDARTWLANEDFGDRHHVLPRGAEIFTRRFVIEVARHRLRDKLLHEPARGGLVRVRQTAEDTW
jgi:hypothetical protein